MSVTVVHVHVKAQHVDNSIRVTATHHRASSKQPGNRRFEVRQPDGDPSRFVLYGPKVNTVDTAGNPSPGYLAWRAAAPPWLSKPRQAVLYRGGFPEEPSRC